MRNGIKEAYTDIIGKKTAEEIQVEEMLKEYGYGTNDEKQMEIAEEV